jgi:hypothetical protein
LTADNSANWTNFSMMNNIISYYPCGIGVSHGFNGLISGNIVDMTLKAKFGNCPGIALGSSDDTVGDLYATNNIVNLGSATLSSAVIGMGIFPKVSVSGSTEMAIIGNVIREVANAGSGPVAAISLNGTNVGNNPPAMIVRNNTTTTSYAVQISNNQVGDIEISNNWFGPNATDHGGVPLANCPGLTVPAIQSGKTVRVFGNHYNGTNPGGVSSTCGDATFSTRQFLEWDNTIGDGTPGTNFAASGFLGRPTRLLWTPGSIPAYSSSSNQVVTVTQAVAGDTVGIINASGSTLLSLPQGVVATGYVSSANTITFNITNKTGTAVNVNGGAQIASYVSVDRPPNNAQTDAASLNGSIALGASNNGGLTATEGTGAGVAPAGGLDVLWADSTAHRFKMNNNNGGAQNVLGDSDWAVPGTIGSTTPNSGTFTTVSTNGSNGGISATEGTGASVPAGASLDVMWPDSTAHRWKMNNNNETTNENVAGTLPSGNVTTAGTVVNAGTCQAQTGITVTGSLTTDNVVVNIGATLPATWQTGIVLSAHVTANGTVTVYLCNPTAGGITPAATQVNVRVLR